MSAICGVVDFDTVNMREGLMTTLSPMLTALVDLGSDGVEQWQQGPAALGRQTRWVLPEDGGRPLLWHGPDGGLTITADARLDNRADLLARLALPACPGCPYTDSQLIAHSYARWGEHCPEYLVGDFAFAIWDETRQWLFCARDPLGERPFVYRQSGRRLLFATAAAALLAAPGVTRRPNHAKLAALALPSFHHHLDEATFYADILSLPAGATLCFDQAGLRLQRYWRPTVPAPLPYTSGAELLEALQALLIEVVRTRLRSSPPVTALLSGGLDSSAMVSAAQRAMAGQATGQPHGLHTLSAVLPPDHDPRLEDERDFIDLFCPHAAWRTSTVDQKASTRIASPGRLTMHYITAPGQGPFDQIATRIAAQESPLLSSRHYLMAAFGEQARAVGSRVLLDGNGGELGLTWHGDGYYAELLLTGRWRTLWRALQERGQVDQQSISTLIKTHLLSPLLPPVLRRVGRQPGVTDEGMVLLQPSFIQTTFGREWATLQRIHQQRQRVWPNQQRNQLRRLEGYYQKHANGPGMLAYAGLETRYPWRDKRLLEFCLAAPAEYKVRDGYKRYLVRAGLAGILPPAIQWRTSKTPFSPDYYQRYLAQQELVQEILATIRPHDPVHEVVDIAALKRSFARSLTASTPAGNADALHRVPAGIYLITFLRQFSEFRP